MKYNSKNQILKISMVTDDTIKMRPKMKGEHRHIRECKTELGGCGNDYITPNKFGSKCPTCIVEGKNERKRIRKLNKVIYGTYSPRKEKSEGSKETETKVYTEFVKCGVCGTLSTRRGVMTHLRNTHPKEYALFMNKVYCMIEKVEKIK